MREQRFTYSKYGWDIRVFYEVECDDSYEIISALKDIGCKGNNLFRAIEAIDACGKNGGLTFANLMTKEMVVMIGGTTSSKEFMNTLVHELHHMAEFIAREAGVPFFGEQISYIVGDLAMKMYKEVGGMLCPHCASKNKQ